MHFIRLVAASESGKQKWGYNTVHMQPSVSVYWNGQVQCCHCYPLVWSTHTNPFRSELGTRKVFRILAEPAFCSSLRWCQSRGLLSQRQSQEEDQLLQRTRGAVACHLWDWPIPRYQPQGEPLSSYGPARVTHPGTWPPLLPNSTKLANLTNEMSYKDKLWRG